MDNPPPGAEGVPTQTSEMSVLNDGGARIGSDGEVARGDDLGGEVADLFLNDRRPALPEGLHLVRIDVDTDDPVSPRCKASRADAADIAEPENTDGIQQRNAHDLLQDILAMVRSRDPTRRARLWLMRRHSVSRGDMAAARPANQARLDTICLPGNQ